MRPHLRTSVLSDIAETEENSSPCNHTGFCDGKQKKMMKHLKAVAYDGYRKLKAWEDQKRCLISARDSSQIP